MSDERPHAERGARSTHEGGTVPGLQPIEVDREIQFRQLVWMGVGLVVVTFLSGVIVFFLLRGFLQAERDAAGPPPPMVAPPVEVPGPRLLARPEQELARVRQLEAEQIDSYGWIDAQQGIARIPIERAIDLVAAKGLPSRPSAPTGPAVEDAVSGTAAASAEPGFRAPVSPGGVMVPAPQDQPPPVDPSPAGTPDAAAPQPTSPGGNR